MSKPATISSVATFCLTFSAILVVTIGCGAEPGPPTVSAIGTITMGGVPVEGAVVVFSPATRTDESQQAAQGETDAEGNFEIQTYIGEQGYKKGVAAGEYSVTVTKLEVPTDMRHQPKHLLPKKYRSPGKTPLKVAVVDGEETRFDFELEE